MTVHRFAYFTVLTALGFVLLTAILHAAPPDPTTKPVAGEKVEKFEYIVNDTEKMTGKRQVMTLDLGGGVTMDVVRIKAGKFTMGSPSGEKNRDPDEIEHEVTLTKDFYLGKYEVTQAQYEAVLGKNPSPDKGKSLPVNTLNWDEAAAFCTALGKKVKRTVELPSEAQWEYACRAGMTTPFHYGLKIDVGRMNSDKGKTVDVGSYKANGFGLHDMHGNVREWCMDYYGPYDKLAGTTDPIQLTKQTENRRVLRGGSWHPVGGDCRAANRNSADYAPDIRSNDIGFRVCVCLD